MELIKSRTFFIVACILVVLSVVIGTFIYYSSDPWGFSRAVSEEEAQLRLSFIAAAEQYWGYNELDGSHQEVVDIYNSHLPLAQGYTVTYTDSWCATFVSAAAIQCNLTDIIPTECGCERQIGLFDALDCWEEKDSYTPLPGDIIYYAWDEPFLFGDCNAWADHVGIVVGTAGPFIKVIEGNKDDQVAYRYIPMNYWQIRGYAIPDYASKLE